MSAPERTTDGSAYAGRVPAQAGVAHPGGTPNGAAETGVALFGGPLGPSTAEFEAASPAAGRGVDYTDIRDSADFAELRGRVLRFVVPATALFMANFMLFVLLSAYAPAFMATPAIGLINVGLLIGVFQFVTTVTIVVAYGRYARTNLDPIAEHIRDEVEGP